MAGRIQIVEARCKGCQLCTTVCPKKLVGMAEHFNALGYRPAGNAEVDRARKRHFRRIGRPRYGRFSGGEIDTVLDAGAYETCSPVVLQRALFTSTGVYDQRSATSITSVVGPMAKSASGPT